MSRKTETHKKIVCSGSRIGKKYLHVKIPPPPSPVKNIMVRPLGYDVPSFVLNSCSYCERQGEPAILIFR